MFAGNDPVAGIGKQTEHFFPGLDGQADHRRVAHRYSGKILHGVTFLLQQGGYFGQQSGMIFLDNGQSLHVDFAPAFSMSLINRSI